MSQTRTAKLLKFGIFVFSVVAITLILVAERYPMLGDEEFIVAEPAPRTFFSPVNLTYTNESATEQLRQRKMQDVLPVFRMDPAIGQEIREKVDQFFIQLHQGQQAVLAGQAPDLSAVPFQVSETTKQILMEEPNLEEIRKNFELVLERSLAQIILDDAQRQKVMQENYGRITVIGNPQESEREIALTDILTLSAVKQSTEGILRTLMPKNRQGRDAIAEIFNATIKPNLIYDEIETKSRRLKVADLAGTVEEKIKKNELIAQRGLLVTDTVKNKLDLIQKKQAKQKVLSKFWAVGLMVLLVHLLGVLYLVFFEKRMLSFFRPIFLIESIVFLTIILCKVISLWAGATVYLMPVALASLLLVLLSNPRVAIVCGALVAIMAGPLSNFNTDVIVATMMSSAAAVFPAIKIRKRIHFLKVGLAIGVTYFLVVFAFQIFHESTVYDAFMVAIQGLANGILITMPLAFLVLPLFESIFDLVTDITLLELSDLNHPILKRMIVEAPGTYHHSLVVSTLAESACEAIGANALLARVGCYFHDIGKIARAEYFMENEARQAMSRHEKVTPTMSCLIILNHVKDGIDLGRRYKLRGPILQFIPEHQGTSIIYFFYRKALEQVGPGEHINSDDFRYPGPKPQSRETAVALLADSTEAASRSLKELNPELIRQAVRKIINDKFIDGQLDECNLTLRDIHKIQESFVQNLMAIFHTRMIYPENPDSAGKPDLFHEGQFSKYRTNP